MEKQSIYHISTRYTLIPITQLSHQIKLQTYMSQPTPPKTSFCRFYLRGLCIMKPQYCKFAHSYQQLILEEDDQQLIRNCSYNQKQRKKLYFQSKQDFQQKALFILKNVDYMVLYQYQFGQTWKNKNNQYAKKLYTPQEIKQQRSIRVRLRQNMHRINWTKLIDFLVQKYPGVDFSISFLSKWFSKVGFQKPQTRCRFADFMRYMIFVKGFKQVNIIMPPRVQKTVFFVNCSQNAQKTYLYQNIEQIQQLHIKAKQEYKKQMVIRLQPLSQQYRKKFICRYYMAGNCQFSQQQCKYAHSIAFLNYQIGQKFQQKHKQMVKGRQQRLNQLSLFQYSVKKINPNITLYELNSHSNIRCEYRRSMHLDLYSDFMKKLQQLTNQNRFKLGFIQQQYNGAGFNHSEQNKFGQFQSALYDIGYVTEEIKLQGAEGKSTYVYNIPPIQQLDKYFTQHINRILQQEADAIKQAEQNIKKFIQKENQQKCNLQDTQTQVNQVQSIKQSQPRQIILESSFRKKLYKVQRPFTVPLHVYLRIKQKTLEEIIKDLTLNKSLLQHIFFQTNEQNYKKLIQLCKSYFKTSKQYVHKLQDIQLYIKSHHKDQINLNSNMTLKSFLQPALIDAGKRIYALKFGNNTLVMDKGNLPGHQKNVIKGIYQLKSYQSKEQQILNKINSSQFSNERIIIVDSHKTQQYAQIFLYNCNKFGVDLEGRLRKDGYIDLIQISSIFNNKKQIFVFDIFFVKKLEDQSLYLKMSNFLKILFEDPSRVKILHDCKQDTTALKFLLNIELKNVFDTSGMNIVLQQKHTYDHWDKKNQTSHHLMKKLFDVKVPGLNAVLQRWDAPNGVNIFKESMKKRFHEDGTRGYFEQRPIDSQFLQYSAQDVQDLVDVYEAMKKQDTDKLSEAIGQIYASYYLSSQ